MKNWIQEYTRLNNWGKVLGVKRQWHWTNKAYRDRLSKAAEIQDWFLGNKLYTECVVHRMCRGDEQL